MGKYILHLVTGLVFDITYLFQIGKRRRQGILHFGMFTFHFKKYKFNTSSICTTSSWRKYTSCEET